MRKQHPPDRARRVRREFLVFPKRIKDETHWWEWACWLEHYTRGTYMGAWFPEKWLAQDDYDCWVVKGQWYLVRHAGTRDATIVTRDEYIASRTERR
ncbi:unnamed protein product [marine sediment metagenome]|uniref:Uncharacterized protein n=1 Tax=marine sediment metagenome TaxID=412755 RepID=X1EMF0_9ZZZZ